ncbi:MAG TPA: hypothetical protein VM686_37090 [Polyangiaceae bacterium]|nr:hypothetical protein [Polyangiaceae bacterium]
MQRTHRLSTALLGATAIVALLSCKKVARQILEEGSKSEAPGAADKPAAPVGPVSITWEQPYKLVAQGVKGEATFFVTRDTDKPPLRLQSAFHEFPTGTKVKIGSEQGVVSQSGFFSTLVDIKPAVVKQSLADLKGPVDLDLELSIEVPGAQPITSKLQKQDVKDGVRFALLKARDGGVTFASSGDEAAAKPRGVAVLSGYSDLEFLGSAQTLLEVDWVAIAEDQKEPRTTKQCQFKEGPSTLKLFDSSAVIVERRSGKVVAEQTLKASDECPMFALVDKTDNSTKNSVAQKDVVAWARAELAKASK